MWEIPDIFSGNPFNPVTLTTRINTAPFTPSLLGSFGDRLFHSTGMRTVDLALAELNGNIEIIETSERGSPPAQGTNAKTKLRKVSAVHFAKERHVKSDELIAAMGEAQLTGRPIQDIAQQLLQERAEGPDGLRAECEYTHEYHRIGAIDGLVLDKDGTPLYDWFDFFGISRPATITINFGTLTAEESKYEEQLMKLRRQVVKACNGLVVTNLKLVKLCGDNYFDAAYTNKEVVAARKNRDVGKEGDRFGPSVAYGSFVYGGCLHINYRGSDDGKVKIPDDEARLLPLDVPGLFQMKFAPPDIMGPLATMPGTPVVMHMPPERQTSRQATVEAQSNPLTLCRRPLSLQRLKKAA